MAPVCSTTNRRRRSPGGLVRYSGELRPDAIGCRRAPVPCGMDGSEDELQAFMAAVTPKESATLATKFGEIADMAAWLGTPARGLHSTGSLDIRGPGSHRLADYPGAEVRTSPVSGDSCPGDAEYQRLSGFQRAGGAVSSARWHG